MYLGSCLQSILLLCKIHFDLNLPFWPNASTMKGEERWLCMLRQKFPSDSESQPGSCWNKQSFDVTAYVCASPGRLLVGLHLSSPNTNNCSHLLVIIELLGAKVKKT
ncbi:hypothetical protein QQP08_010612 [Theobroma cacao]|nr:hypothetical protein QQP08_010612 [Theobroma cacao]